MNHQTAIEEAFLGKAFLRPLFYAYPGGLRFQLSEGGHAIDQFLTAHRKAAEICRDIFSVNETLTVCLRVHHVHESRFAYRSTLRELANAGIDIPSFRSIWLEPAANAMDTVDYSLLVAFSVPSLFLSRLLWCALSSDFGSIRPGPRCTIYLFNLTARVMVLPYDDRGMDVVGSDHALLARLYRRHDAYLLAHDREAMQRTFALDVEQQDRTFT